MAVNNLSDDLRIFPIFLGSSKFSIMTAFFLYVISFYFLDTLVYFTRLACKIHAKFIDYIFVVL